MNANGACSRRICVVAFLRPALCSAIHLTRLLLYLPPLSLMAIPAQAPVCFTGKCCNVDSLSFKQDGTTCAYDLSDALLQPTTTTTTAIASTNSNSFRRQLTHKEHPEDWPLCSGTCQRGTCALAPQRKAGCCRLALPQAQPGVDGVSLTQAVWRTVDVSGKTSNAARWTLTCWQG